MAVVLEGYCKLTRKTTYQNRITSQVTSFSGDYVSESLCIYIYSYSAHRYYKIQSYTNSAWSSISKTVRDTLPHSFELYLVRSSDFRDDSYDEPDYWESFDALALRKYICKVESLNVDYYWTPASTPLSTPTGLYADNIKSDSARVSWNAVENASGYKVEYRQSAGGGQTYPWIEASD